MRWMLMDLATLMKATFRTSPPRVFSFTVLLSFVSSFEISKFVFEMWIIQTCFQRQNKIDTCTFQTQGESEREMQNMNNTAGGGIITR